MNLHTESDLYDIYCECVARWLEVFANNVQHMTGAVVLNPLARFDHERVYAAMMNGNSPQDTAGFLL